MPEPGLPTISTVIPVFDAERYVREAIASVLAQTRPSSQVVVVDDGSTDGSAAAIRSFGDRIEYVRQENRGIGAARNTGLRRVTGDYVAFLDADDVWASHKLEVQGAALDEHPEVDLVFGMVDHFVSPDLDETEAARLVCPSDPVAGIVAGVMLARRPLFDEVGPFVEDLRLGEFLDWFGRARESGASHVTLQDVVYRRRLHRDNTGRRESDARGDYARVLKGMLDRRRGRQADGR